MINYHNFPTHPYYRGHGMTSCSGAVRVRRPCRALEIYHTGGSVVRVGGVILVFNIRAHTHGLGILPDQRTRILSVQPPCQKEKVP